MKIMRWLPAVLMIYISIFGCVSFAEDEAVAKETVISDAISEEAIKKALPSKVLLQKRVPRKTLSQENIPAKKEKIAIEKVPPQKTMLQVKTSATLPAKKIPAEKLIAKAVSGPAVEKIPPQKAMLQNRGTQILPERKEWRRNSYVWETIAADKISEHLYTIVTNPGEDCSAEMNINFHADLEFEECFVEYTAADDMWWQEAFEQVGTYAAFGYDSSSNPFYRLTEENNQKGNVFLDYNVTLKNLQPNTQYKYRIFDGESYSEVRYFKTAGADEWSFVVTGDFHEYKKGYVPNRAANAAMAIAAASELAEQLEMPSVEHIVAVGDIVAYGSYYAQWKQLYEQPFIRNYSFASVIGNHDATSPSGKRSGKHAAICSNYPLNGNEEQKGISYYYLRGNVLFLCLTYWDNPSEAQAWASNVLNSMAGRYTYSVLVNHYSTLSKYSGGGFAEFWTDWSAFCDSNKIDLVLTGDHHVYMRSYPLYEGAVVENYSADNPDGTVYITADSSDGDRGSTKEEVAKNWKSHVAAKYYRYLYGGTSHDITSILISVSEEKMTVRFVYYEDRRAAEKSSSFCEGTVDGHEFFFYGDTSCVYPSAH